MSGKHASGELHALIGGVSEARAVDVVLRLIRARGRVVRRKPAHRSCCQSSMVSKVKLTCSTSSWSNITTESNAAALSAHSPQSDTMYECSYVQMKPK